MYSIFYLSLQTFNLNTYSGSDKDYLVAAYEGIMVLFADYKDFIVDLTETEQDNIWFEVSTRLT